MVIWRRLLNPRMRSETGASIAVPPESSKAVDTANYRRVDLDALAKTDPDGGSAIAGSATEAPPSPRVRWFVPPMAVLLSLLQSCLWVYASNARGTAVTGSLIPVLGLALLLIAVLVINPVIQLSGLARLIAPFRRGELVVIFAALFVTAGISTYGLVEQVVPLIAAPHNPNWNKAQRGWQDTVIPRLNHHLFITDPDAIQQFRDGVGPAETPSQSVLDQVSAHAETAGRLPWRLWLGPLAAWSGLVIAAYTMFYGLTHLALPFWSQREKMIFPLARLPEALLPDSDTAAGRVPALLRGPGFWIGFSISFLVLGWNGLAQSGAVTGISTIRLGMSSWVAIEVFQGSFLEGMDYALAFLVIFTAIGLAFLLPLEMSFSVWFYYLLSRGALLMMIRAGYARNALDIRADSSMRSDLFSSQAGGGLLCFAVIAMARAIYELKRQGDGKPLRARLAIASPLGLVLIGVLGLAGWLSWNHLPLGWALAMSIVTALVTLGLMRLVCEAGIYWFQPYIGFFHIHRFLGLGKFLPNSVLAPILPLHSVLFLDVKCFLPPALISAAKLRQDVGVNRVVYHATVITSMVVSIVGSVVFVLTLAYRRGADRMFKWFYTDSPTRLFDSVYRMAAAVPAIEPANVTAFCFGAVWVAASAMLRRWYFWFPHPVGYIALVNPLMEQLWFCFFIAWLLKAPLIRYGGKLTFEKARSAAIGLIMGELVAILLWTGVALATGIPFANISLNRYGP